ncbi:hypothetical protein CXG81DRAFT_13004 [Caulochytrium protostelioides]|uniref:non-specific serine/threonine protein kinase n=1 Tax=Caulochytrium protostelioides TaxID=1555241 RepID=A0A4P9X643_9FUNG|nr:hypothetical protein CXG81DRAFT_13004 [Caulochytrium protostelioides]|eukprot:RKP00612.1 hypothetical protein CXG81DRAFT_13004 [Caulochytrium protostelioides]
MHAYGPSYRLAGGRSRPKILTVTDTRGVVHRQILKAHDDLRQDAIIANLFTIMNRLFERHPDCKGRQLAIRTYNIVPLASSLGLVEWVDGAEVMYTCLERLYRRTQLNTWSLEQCRRYASQQMDVLVQPVDACVAAFHEIQRHVPPVLRLAFYESFTSIQHWLAQRDRYTNSVAATSIAGFVVGLGDRHLSNIMLHSQSGEVVHIDLGIAFGQGKILRVPERVPFRLTANLVDALGTLGAAGGFEQQCIRVLTALRESPLAIETTLDILRYAPLSTWLPAHVATRLERDERDEAVAGDAAAPATRRDERNQGSKAAMHAALSVRRRLTSAVSVRSQVRDLIAEACDARNLAQMFRGWQSWL